MTATRLFEIDDDRAGGTRTMGLTMPGADPIGTTVNWADKRGPDQLCAELTSWADLLSPSGER